MLGVVDKVFSIELTTNNSIKVNKGDYIQYRLALGAKNSLRTPRVSAVTVNFE
ncbi:MAG: hypothetical protein IJW31_06445 [Lentisphaeria bacterium]|nr:hypothetical protein [Lentisphaeria bacterium]